MSTATSFRHHRPFPCCIPAWPIGDSEISTVDVTLADAMSLYWNLESLEFTTDQGTFTIGPTESLPTNFSVSARGGAYYAGGTTPSALPFSRVKMEVGSNPTSPILFSSQDTITDPLIGSAFNLSFYFYLSANPALPIRILYDFYFTYYYQMSSVVYGIVSKNYTNGYANSPADSGTINIAGMDFEYNSGYYDFSALEWLLVQPTTPSVSCTYGMFTY